MRTRSRRRARWALPLFAALALSCGDDGGGCGAEEPKKQEESSGGGGGGATSGGGGGAEIVISEKRSKKVPKPYQREGGEDAAVSASGGQAAPAQEAKPAPAAAPAAAAPPSSSTAPARVSLPVARVIRRRVDGISNRVEVKCRVMASSPDGECSAAQNYQEIKDRCCPGGIVERCKVGLRGVLLIGLDCEAGLKK